MKLISIKLENYRQHRDTYLEFPEGVTAIIGPNGSGKSTLLEGIAWAIYGQRANQRDKAKDILWQRAPGKAVVRVELVFELHGQRYRAARDLKTASLHLEGKAAPIVTGLNDVTAYLETRLAMDYRAFFNSYFTRQKELTFLANESAGERQKLINKMLGLEALEKTRRNVNGDRLTHQRQIEGMERGLVNLEDLAAQRVRIQEAIAQAELAWQEAGRLAAGDEADFQALLPTFQASAERAELRRELQGQLERVQQEAAHLNKDLSRLAEELQELRRSGEELLLLQPELERWEELQTQYLAQEALQRHEGRRQQLAGQLTSLTRQAEQWQQEADRAAATLQDDALARSRQAVMLAKQQADELTDQARSKEIGWREELAVIKSELAGKRKERNAVVKRQEVIAKGGGAGNCPTCLRAVDPGELPEVLQALAEQLAELDGEIAGLERRQAEDQVHSEQLALLAKELQTLQRRHEELRQQESRLAAGEAVLHKVQASLGQNAMERQRLTAELAELPRGFDATLWESLRAERKRLEPRKTREAELRARLKDKGRQEERMAAARQALAANQAQHAAVQAAVTALGFSPEEHQRLEQELAVREARRRQGQEQVAARHGELQKQQGRLEEWQRQEAEARLKQAQLELLRQEHRYLVVLEDHLERLRSELNGRVRPELEASASQFLEQLTDGRYRGLELDENYGIRVVDEGESFDLARYSGGENDVAHLCLRLAISEMIMQRAGQPLSLIILDEVFGSLDDARRDNVMTLLESLSQRFSQIILITHIEEVKHAVEHLIRVGFDEKSGASYVEIEPGLEVGATVYA